MFVERVVALLMFCMIAPHLAAQEKMNFSFYFKMDREVQNYYSSIAMHSLAAEAGVINPSLQGKIEALIASPSFREAYNRKIAGILDGSPEGRKNNHPVDVLAQLMIANVPDLAPILGKPTRPMEDAAAMLQLKAVVLDSPNGFSRLRAAIDKPDRWNGPIVDSPLGVNYTRLDPDKRTARFFFMPVTGDMSRDDITALDSRLHALMVGSLMGWRGGKVVEDSSSSFHLFKVLRIAFADGTTAELALATDEAKNQIYLTITVTSPLLPAV